MAGYTTREVSEVLGLQPRQVRALARWGLAEPSRGAGREYRFAFSDIVLLRAAVELREHDITPRRIREALGRLREQLPAGRPLTAVRITVVGDRVVVRDRETAWEPATGQVTLDFAVGDLAARVEPFAPRAMAERVGEGDLAADDWYELGLELEAVSVTEATDAYSEAISLDPGHAEAHLNLGRLLHEGGQLEEAESHYRRALELEPRSGLAWFNVGVACEDGGRPADALHAYERAVGLDPSLPSAHFNLSRLYERGGDVQAAVRHLAAYKRLREPRPTR